MISIVVASLGILGGLVRHAVAVRVLVPGAVRRHAAARGDADARGTDDRAGAAAAAPANPDLPVSPRGLDAAERAAVASGWPSCGSSPGPRLEQLDVLLAKAGQDMFPVPEGTPRTAEAVEEMVLGHAAGLSANPERGGAGHVSHARAGGSSFTTTARCSTRATARSSARPPSRPRRAGLTPEQVEQVVAAGAGRRRQRDEPVAGRRPAHAARDAGPAARLAHHGADGRPRRSARAATARYDVTFPNGWATIGPQGQVVSSLAGGRRGGPAPAAARSARTARPWRCRCSRRVVGMGLALYLLVCGILVLRESPRGRRLHLIYAVLKIPVAIAGALAVWWLTSDFIAAAQRPANASASFAASSAGETRRPPTSGWACWGSSTRSRC